MGNNEPINIDEIRSTNISINIDGRNIILRPLTMKDAFLAKRLLEKGISSDDFIYRLLHNQLITPEIDFEEFRSINEENIKEIALKFIESDRLLNKNFSRDSSDFFKNFKITTEKCVNNLLKTIKTNLNFSSGNAYIGNMSKITRITPIAPNFVNNLINRDINTQKLYWGSDLNKQVSSVQNLFLYQREVFDNLYKPMVTFTKRWVSLNKTLLIPFEKQFSLLEAKHIDLTRAKNILKDYQWFITPSMPFDFINKIIDLEKDVGNQRERINDLYYNYFSEDNFQNIDKMFSRWVSTGLLRPTRVRIIEHCIDLLKESSLSNPAYLIVPTLISQIDGIQSKLMVANDLKSLSEKKWKDRNGKTIYISDFFDMECNGLITLESAKDIFLDVLFESVYPEDAISYPITFNRHKILHGQYINYGTKYNVIRAFLIIDFLMFLCKGTKN